MTIILSCLSAAEMILGRASPSGRGGISGGAECEGLGGANSGLERRTGLEMLEEGRQRLAMTCGKRERS